ncbi:lysophospholipid acyltransferase family protein [Bdellovibrio sp. HCB2-146]|uniref:lysophospholipid acyltransferase family protein n=1 Tax=Bdellovibrio sp. HCB2-146 TaxID=3394362 RepID=UPI0039BD1D22
MEEIQAGLRGVIRLFIFIAIVLFFLAWSFVCHLIYRDETTRHRKFSENTTRVCGWIIRAFDIRLKVVNRPTQFTPCLLVSNHMGFLDILCLASVNPMLFVTSHEMRETPFLGLLTEMGGCLYVERRSRTKILDEMKNIVKAMQNGLRVVLYPEATSTNGEQVLPFKRTLMMAAAHAGVPIQPVVFNYRSINGEEFSLKWRDHVCWYGDIPFATSMWKALTLKYIDAEIEFLEPMMVDKDEDRGLVADRAHAAIAAKFVPVKGLPAPEPVPSMETT